MGVLICAGPAFAYVPPSEYILKQLAKKRAGTVSIRTRSIVAAVEGTQPTAIRYRLMSQLDVPSRKIRVRAYDEAGKELYATSREIPSDPGIALDASRLLVGTAFELLADPRGDVVVSTLIGQSIPVHTEAELMKLSTEEERRAAEQTSLGRMGSEVVWMLGPAKKAAFQPQVWIEKETFLPLRLITHADEGRMDFRFQNYKFTREFPFPRVIEVRQADAANRILFQEMVQDFWVNPEGNEMSRGFAGEGFTEAGNQAATTIRELILSSIRILR